MTPKWRFVLTAGALAVIALAVTPLQDLLTALATPANLKTYKTVSAIPKPVRQAFPRKSDPAPFDMAEPGGRFQSTDVLVGKLPLHRLVEVALSDRYCVIFYETGGFALAYHTDVFQLDKDSAKLIWESGPSRAVADLASLRNAILAEQKK